MISLHGVRGLSLGLVLLVSLVALVFYGANPFDAELAPGVVTTRPRERDRLSPQLRSYLLTKAEWVDQSVTDPARHRTLGLIYEANEVWQEAYDSFTVASTLEPDHALTQYHRARCLIRLGRIDEAEAMLAAIAGAHPDLSPAVWRWGELLLDRGLFEEARQAFALVTEHRPEAPHGYVGRGAARVLSSSYLSRVFSKTRLCWPDAR